jgi:hypothetical protein
VRMNRMEKEMVEKKKLNNIKKETKNKNGLR